MSVEGNARVSVKENGWEPVEDIAAAVRSRRLRAVDVVSGALERIGRVDPALCAFAEVWE